MPLGMTPECSIVTVNQRSISFRLDPHHNSSLSRLLPDAITLRLEAWHIDDAAAQITLLVTSRQARVPCPLCTRVTPQVHSRVCTDPRRSTLGQLPRALAAAGAEVFLHQSRLPAADFHRTPAHRDGPRGPPDDAAHGAIKRLRGCTRRRGRHTTRPALQPRRESGHAVAARVRCAPAGPPTALCGRSR